MRPAAGAREFLERPAGTFVGGRNWLFFCIDAGLFGQVYWGTPDAADAAELTKVWQVELLPETAPHVSFVDASRLDRMDRQWFALMGRELQRHRERLAEKLQKQAVLRPTGLAGAEVAGFFEVLEPAHSVQVFSEAAAALRWLGRPEMLDTVTAIAERALGHDPLVRALRQHLAAAFVDATLPTAARALGVASRTLQRRLREAGTGFHQEALDARVRAAERLLAEDGYKLTAIAREVGCSSLQHFTQLFRKIHGMSPAEWRAARR